MKKITVLLLMLYASLFGVEYNALKNALANVSADFTYPLALKIIPGKAEEPHTMLCFHGTGADSDIASSVASIGAVSDHIVSFNFPDYDLYSRGISFINSSYGTINQLLPALYLLKKIAVDGGETKISIYGFSSGAAAVINAISTLNGARYDKELAAIGITIDDKKRILAALENGVLLLDCPVKSEEERIETGVENRDLTAFAVAKRARANGLVPIEALSLWKGLTLTTIVFFQNPDEAVANRDDSLFAKRLREINPHGKNIILEGDEGGHCGFHRSLWQAYSRLRIHEYHRMVKGAKPPGV